MNCKWCNKEMNGANDYQLAGFCNVNCRHKGGDSDKINLEAEKNAAPNVIVPTPQPVVEKKPKIKKPKPQEIVPKLEDFFAKSTLKKDE